MCDRLATACKSLVSIVPPIRERSGLPEALGTLASAFTLPGTPTGRLQRLASVHDYRRGAASFTIAPHSVRERAHHAPVLSMPIERARLQATSPPEAPGSAA